MPNISPSHHNTANKKGGFSFRKVIFVLFTVICICLTAFFVARVVMSFAAPQEIIPNPSSAAETNIAEIPAETTVTETSAPPAETTTTTTNPKLAGSSGEPFSIDEEFPVIAGHVILLEDAAEGRRVLAERSADEVMYPASMTKIMSLLTFFDLVPEEKLSETIPMEAAVIASADAQQAYRAGFAAGEECLISDLLYAMMLPSGADAAIMLATYAAGSEEQFVIRMNDLASNLGLEKTHFVNCTGLHDENHVSTAAEMSQILMKALENPRCCEIMSTLRHTTASTPEHPDGIQLTSTTLSRMVGNELEKLPDPLHIIGGKTGYTNPAGQCLATWAESAEGRRYVCVIANSTALQPLDAIADTLTVYQLTGIEPEKIERITVDEADLPYYEHY